MIFWEVLLIVSLFLVFYNYAGYALLAYLLTRLRGRKERIRDEDGYTPPVTFIVAAYNEADCIDEKIANCEALDYPKERMELIIVTDGSTDRTPEIVQQNTRVRLLHESERRGKCAAMNRAVAQASHNILIFSDANTVLNAAAIRQIVRHYQDPGTGGVAGEKKVIPSSASAES